MLHSPLASLGENTAVSGDCLTPHSARGEPGSQDGLPATRAAAYRRIIFISFIATVVTSLQQSLSPFYLNSKFLQKIEIRFSFFTSMQRNPASLA
jgi:hypothetical protein